jgi:hypothetical protein
MVGCHTESSAMEFANPRTVAMIGEQPNNWTRDFAQETCPEIIATRHANSTPDGRLIMNMQGHHPDGQLL